MLTRRHVLGTALTAAASLPFAPAARAAGDWRAAFPEIVFATIPEENASGVTDRYAGFVDYLSKQLGVKVTLRIANDYAAIIEGQRAGNIHVAYYGPASFARALVTGVKTTAFAIDVNSDGTKGYYSVFYVKADSPYKTIEDLKGKAVGLVDPNSTSGYNMPLYTLNKMGIDPKTFFSNLLITGSHENAVIALAGGQVETCGNFWNAPGDSNLSRMLKKGMLKKPDGSPMEGKRLSHRAEIRPHHQLADRLPRRAAGRHEGRSSAKPFSTRPPRRRRLSPGSATARTSHGRPSPTPITTTRSSSSGSSTALKKKS